MAHDSGGFCEDDDPLKQPTRHLSEGRTLFNSLDFTWRYLYPPVGRNIASVDMVNIS